MVSDLWTIAISGFSAMVGGGFGGGMMLFILGGHRTGIKEAKAQAAAALKVADAAVDKPLCDERFGILHGILKGEGQDTGIVGAVEMSQRDIADMKVILVEIRTHQKNGGPG
jgi:hypothetical protein